MLITSEKRKHPPHCRMLLLDLKRDRRTREMFEKFCQLFQIIEIDFTIHIHTFAQVIEMSNEIFP
jgi:hypothetical protein